MKKQLILVNAGKLLIDVAPKAASTTIMSIFLENKNLRPGSHLQKGTYWNYLKNNNMDKLAKEKILIKIVRNPYERALSVYSHFKRGVKNDISIDMFFKKVENLHHIMRNEKISFDLSNNQIEKTKSIFPELETNMTLIEILGLQKNYNNIKFDHLFKLDDLERAVNFLENEYSLSLKNKKIPKLNESSTKPGGVMCPNKITEKQKSLILKVYSEDFLLYSSAEFAK